MRLGLVAVYPGRAEGIIHVIWPEEEGSFHCEEAAPRAIVKISNHGVNPLFHVSMLRTTMNALRFAQKGVIESVLKLEQVPKPSLATGEALVRVKAAGINGVR